MQKGGFVQDTLEKLGELAKDSGKAVVNEPLKILQQALGVNENDDNSNPLEQGVATSNQQFAQKLGSQNSADALLNKKKLEDKDRVQKLLALHRQRLREEEGFFEQSQAEKDQQKRLKEQEEYQDEQQEIIQLQHQEAKDAVLSSPTSSAGNGPQAPGAVKQAQKLTGTKEIGKSKGD